MKESAKGRFFEEKKSTTEVKSVPYHTFKFTLNLQVGWGGVQNWGSSNLSFLKPFRYLLMIITII